MAGAGAVHLSYHGNAVHAKACMRWLPANASSVILIWSCATALFVLFKMRCLQSALEKPETITVIRSWDRGLVKVRVWEIYTRCVRILQDKPDDSPIQIAIKISDVRAQVKRKLSCCCRYSLWAHGWTPYERARASLCARHSAMLWQPTAIYLMNWRQVTVDINKVSEDRNLWHVPMPATIEWEYMNMNHQKIPPTEFPVEVALHDDVWLPVTVSTAYQLGNRNKNLFLA